MRGSYEYLITQLGFSHDHQIRVCSFFLLGEGDCGEDGGRLIGAEEEVGMPQRRGRRQSPAVEERALANQFGGQVPALASVHVQQIEVDSRHVRHCPPTL